MKKMTNSDKDDYVRQQRCNFKILHMHQGMGVSNLGDYTYMVMEGCCRQNIRKKINF